MTTSFTHRKDTRDIETFAGNIKDYSTKEQHWAKALEIDLQERGQKCTIEDNGVDNTGELIRGSLANYNVDFKIVFEDGKIQPIEVKTIPEWVKDFMTFKVTSLSSCLQQNASILVPKLSVYYVITPDAITKMVTNYEHRIFESFSPNDPCVRVPMGDIEQMIDDKIISKDYWTDKADSYVRNNHDILVKPKRR